MKHFLLTLILLLSFGAKAQLNFLEKKISSPSFTQVMTKALDLDLDGDIDIVAVYGKEGKIVWLENDGNQNFTQHLLYKIIEEIDWAEMIDADSDGLLDIVYRIPYATGIEYQVLYNRGGLNFQKEDLLVDYNLSLGSQDFKWADLDLDGDLDFFRNVYFYENDGAQNFTMDTLNFDTTTYTSSSSFGAFIDAGLTDVADFDADGDLDIVKYGNLGYVVCENDGNQNFTVHQIFHQSGNDTYYGPAFSSGVKVADFDNDGDLDFLGGPMEHLYWFENDGNFNFVDNYLYDYSYNYFSSDLADVNNDGYLDIVISTSNGVFFSLIDSNQTPFSYVSGASAAIDYIPFLFVSFADINSDGKQDILLSSKYHVQKMSWVEHDPAYTYLPHYVPNNIHSIQHNYRNQLSKNDDVWVEDIDGDGFKDILTKSYGKVCWYKNNNNNQSYDYREVYDFGEFGLITHNVGDSRTKDMDNDGDIDIISTFFKDSTIYYFQNDGSENFTRIAIASQLPSVRSLDINDIDADGDYDVVVFSDPNGVYLLENDGANNFTKHALTSGALTGLSNVYCVDLDQDNDLDIVYSAKGNNILAWLQNNGSLNFSTQIISNSLNGITSFEIEDLDNDGDLDIVSSGHTAGAINYLENDGNQNFSTLLLHSNGVGAGKVVIDDIDFDGDKDILFTNAVDSNFGLGVLLNNGGAGLSFQATTLPSVGFGGTAMALVDIDNDSDMDIISPELSIYENLQNNSRLLLVKPFLDVNENSIKEPNEPIIQNIQASLTSSNMYNYSSDSTLQFYIANLGSYLVQLDVDTSIWNYSDSLTRNIDINSFLTHEVYIGLSLKDTNSYRVNTDITNTWMRCGNSVYLYLNVQNIGKHIDTGYFSYSLHDSLTFQQSIPAPTHIMGNQLIFEYTDFEPAQVQNFRIEFVPALITIEVYNELRAYATIAGADTLYEYNRWAERIRCSYDPNDKQVSPQYTEQGYMFEEDSLRFQIRFQNTGNDTAFLVVIRDTIDPNLDLSTFKLITSSHPVVVQMDRNTRELVFTFNDIILTDTATNEAESHGFVKYELKPKENIALESEINNTAYIYFDQNSPIQTNTTLNTIYDCSLLGKNIVAHSLSLESEDDILNIDLNESFVTSATWKWNSNNISSDLSALSYQPTEVRLSDTLSLTLENELCKLDTFWLINSKWLSVNDIEGNTIEVYPNPIVNELQINFEELPQEKLLIEIYNVQGKRVWVGKRKQLKETINTSEWSSGVYHISIKKLKAKNVLAVFKVLKK